MSRYIDVDEVLEQIRKKLGIKSLDYLLEAERQIVDAIQSVPSIDIIFCKECKFNYGNEHNCSFNPNDIVCTYWESDGLQSDDFCSYGEREGE